MERKMTQLCELTQIGRIGNVKEVGQNLMISVASDASGVVALCAGWNILSLIMILTSPETFGIDMSRIGGLGRSRGRGGWSDPVGAR
jgi:hypothetical protein